MKKSDLTKLIAIGAAVTAAAATTAIVISKHKKHKTMLAEHTKTLTKKQAYITGGGLSAFASALYLVRDCGFTPENIHIFTNGTRNCGNNETGFICRRGKTISIKDSMNFFDLISDVDSLDIPDLTVCDEILNIQAKGLKKRLEHTHCKSAVIGISGGLDSTLALLVTAKAFDKSFIFISFPYLERKYKYKNTFIASLLA